MSKKNNITKTDLELVVLEEMLMHNKFENASTLNYSVSIKKENYPYQLIDVRNTSWNMYFKKSEQYTECFFVSKDKDVMYYRNEFNEEVSPQGILKYYLNNYDYFLTRKYPTIKTTMKDIISKYVDIYTGKEDFEGWLYSGSGSFAGFLCGGLYGIISEDLRWTLLVNGAIIGAILPPVIMGVHSIAKNIADSVIITHKKNQSIKELENLNIYVGEEAINQIDLGMKKHVINSMNNYIKYLNS